ncbi:hypothetical protein [Brachybacterium saurashtrense]|uniref:Uncharacterized protein n=1 Tax=Brachybacterium saurashtrense TaxID=556288 RepID=A0A345YNX4_9MICO|nr:hypothetical protein [Brachybacterium saurashtrense]AXK45626.1 hypothetical protein DWV08_08385 [Brachybacterium saurashtrense]RRR24643.1 hypothetical protein DXU92_00130 [Brachybacterium saurashtrense]
MSTVDPEEPRQDGPGDPDGTGRPADDIDAEFARLTEGLTLDDAPLTVEDVLTEDAGEEQEPAVAVVATSVVTAKALAGVIRLGREARTDGIDIPTGTRTLDTGTGAIAVGPHAETAAHDLAAITSAALQRNGIVLFWRRGDRMTATRYKNGERGEDISPAIVLGAVDDVVEELLLGATDLAELGEGLDPSALTRAEALEWIASGKKRK